jgi:N-acetyl-alpha-D-muramate 1-phosphate uridylyltransferase
MIALSHAMVLAAGEGRRMRPLTEETPKPLLQLAGRTLLDHALDRVADAGIGEAVVNAHWLADQVARTAAARTRPRCTLSREPVLLETGGGVKRALPLLGDGPFLAVNGDAFWLDGPSPTITRLAQAFDAAEMDALLLLVRTTQISAEVGRGDFLLDPLGRARRPREREIAPYLFGGVQIVSPKLFDETPDGAFSLNLLYDRAIEAGRLHGLVHDGLWFHLSTPRDLADAESAIGAGLVRAVF